MQDVTEFIKIFVQTCNKIDAMALIITQEYASSVNETRTCFVTSYSVPPLPFSSLCTRDRIPELNSRLTSFADCTFKYATNKDDEVDEIKIVSKSQKVNLNFKCARQKVILGQQKTIHDVGTGDRPVPPKKIRLNPFYHIYMSAEELKDLNTISKAIKSDYCLINSDNGVSIILTSDNGEKGKLDLERPVTMLVGEASPTFAFRYPTKVLFKMLDFVDINTGIIIGDNGFIKLEHEKVFEIYIPQVKNAI